jgi:hypothetical protein
MEVSVQPQKNKTEEEMSEWIIQCRVSELGGGIDIGGPMPNVPPNLSIQTDHAWNAKT